MKPIPPGQWVQINVFRPKPGQMDAFIETQLRRLPVLGAVPGLLASRLYRANDERDAVLVSTWEDEAAQSSFLHTSAFQEQRSALRPLLDSASPGSYTLVYARGDTDAAPR